MLDFGEGRYDVLVCTTIIEAGLDIPNVNTILINRANHFGLAQLYQLRGRVGRGANRAYAYFLHDREYQLTETAEKRLDVIREATDLGAGFRVAMKDLEIRGAGNLLGAEQHGHIAAVGFDLYTRMLADAVAALKELRGEEPETEAAPVAPGAQQPSLDLPLNAFLPPDYVAGETERLGLYRRMSALHSAADVAAMAGELRERFGPPPPAAENLLYRLQVRVRAAAGHVPRSRSAMRPSSSAWAPMPFPTVPPWSSALALPCASRARTPCGWTAPGLAASGARRCCSWPPCWRGPAGPGGG